MLVGVLAALLGTAMATALGVPVTGGIDWIELAIQVVLAAIGVSIAVAITGRRGARPT